MITALKSWSRPVLLAGAISLPLVACETSKEQTGLVVGAIGGAVIGSRFGSGIGNVAATALGGVLGAYFGAYIGRRLDERDRAYMGNATNTALNNAPNNQTVTWNNPDTGNSGAVTPTSTQKTSSGAVCRTFDTSVTAGGETENRQGRACQNQDGSWQVVA